MTGRGVVASALVWVLAACGGGAIDIDEADLSAADRARCEALVEDLPGTLAGEQRRAVEPDDALGAAWGEPAYVLTCGVTAPDDYEPTAVCSVIEGVGWYVTDEELSDLGEDATPVALSLSPLVRVEVPSTYRTEGVDRALADLAPALKEHLDQGLPCL